MLILLGSPPPRIPISIKIFGGQDVDDHAYPWLAALGYGQVKLNSKPKYLCGGTIISDRHILTAAHCLSQPNNPFKVVRGYKEMTLGEQKISNTNKFLNDCCIFQLMNGCCATCFVG